MVIVVPTNDATYPFDLSKDEGEFYNLDVPVSAMNGIDKHLAYYDWLANSTTSQIREMHLLPTNHSLIK